MKLVQVTIPNWSKFNARTDRANYTWFRFQNEFFQDQKMFGLSDSQMILFLMLLCEVSRRNKGTVDVNLDYLAAIRQTTTSKISKDLQELISRGVVEPANGHQMVDELPATDRQTDRQTERNNSSSLVQFPKPGEGGLKKRLRETEGPLAKYLKEINDSAVEAWLALYTDPDWIYRTILEAIPYLEKNPSLYAKDPTGFFAGSLKRNWAWRQKDQAKEKPKSTAETW